MDTIFGLPAHVLIVHAVVVLLPLAALVGIAAAAKASWLFYLRWPLLGLAVLGAGAAWLAEGAGESLEERLGGSAAIEEHAEAGELLVIAAMLFLAAVVAMIVTTTVRSPLVSGKGAYTGRGPQMLSMVLRGVVVGVAVWVLVQTAITGHTGSSAAWQDVVQSTVPSEPGHTDSD